MDSTFVIYAFKQTIVHFRVQNNKIPFVICIIAKLTIYISIDYFIFLLQNIDLWFISKTDP